MTPPISRREFLRVAGYGCVLAAGASVGGCSLPPLTALMADPPRPNPPRARSTWRTGLCAMCPGGCGIRARLVEGRVVGISGNPLHPISRGALCPRGAAGAEALYDADRPREPVRRNAGVEEPIPWAAATIEAAAGIRNAQAAGAPIAFVHAGPSALDAALASRFAGALGAIEVDLRTYRTPRALAAFAATQGIACPVHFDIARADVVVSFDPGLLEAPWSAVQIQRAFAEFRRGRPEKRGRFIVVSPRRTTTAIKADEWISVRPGAEGVLALGVAHVLAKENLVDWEGLETTVSGGADFRREVLSGYGMDEVSRATGVPEAAIVGIARDLASAASPVVIPPIESDVISPVNVAAIHTLNALLDRIDKPGGVLVGRSQETIHLAPAPGAAPPVADAHADEPLCERILGGFPVGVLLIHDANPVADLPDGQRWADAIRRVPLVVSFSSRRDETSALAHLHLPDATYLEKWQVHAGATTEGYPVWSAGEPVVEADGAKPLGETLIALARAIGGAPAEAFPWADTAEIVRRYAEDLHGRLRQGIFFGPDVEEMWSSLLERSGWRSSTVGARARFHARWTETGGWWDPHYPYGETRRVLAHPDLRFRLPSEFAVPENPTGDARDYPLLAVAHRPAVLAGGGPGGLPALRGLIANRGWPVGETFVEIHPEDARAAGVVDGAAVRVVSPHGAVRSVAKITVGVARGVVAVLVGLGRSAGTRWEVGFGSYGLGLFDTLHHRQGKGLAARVRLEIV